MIAQLILAGTLYLALIALTLQLCPLRGPFFSSAPMGGMATLALVLLLYVSPFEAADLSISDSVEYVAVTVNAIEHGVFGLPLDDQFVAPSRYPPWFSAFVLQPWYRVFGTFPGVGILLNSFFLLLGGYALFCVVHRISESSTSAPLFVLLLLAVPGLRYFSGHILTDVPSMVLAILAVGWTLRLVDSQTTDKTPEFSLLLAAAVLLLGVILRPTNLVLGLPLTYVLWRNKRVDALLLWTPSVALGLSQLWYNAKVFGSPWLSGYHYWVPVPYQSIFETFTFVALTSNVWAFSVDVFMPLAALLGLMLCLRRMGKSLVLELQLLRAIGLMILPLLLFYLPYFYYTPRFFLPVHALLWAGVAALGAKLWRPSAFAAQCSACLFLVLALTFQAIREEKKPIRLLVMQQLLAQASGEDTISSTIDPVYAQLWISRLPQEDRPTYLATSRDSEFASKAVTLSALPKPFPSWRDGAATREFLLSHGAKLPVRHTLLDQDGVSIDARGKVYLDQRLLSPELLEQVRSQQLPHLVLIN